MTLRLHVDSALSAGLHLRLPTGAARHVQVMRLQPGAGLVLFDGTGGQWQATVTHMGRSEVHVVVEAHEAVERELAAEVTLAVGMPANDRFDWLVEKATELGACAIQPLVCERSVLRVAGERAARKREHWQAVAVAAAEQCGRNRVPVLHPVHEFGAWLQAAPLPAGTHAQVLSLAEETRPALDLLQAAAAPGTGRPSWLILSGPEGGLSPGEDALARRSGFAPVSLGARVLRAETAPLAWLGLCAALVGEQAT